jgi:predicted transcriptional regulator YdeE
MNSSTLNTMTIAGLELRTSNAQAFETIPAHWQRFYAEAVLAQIPDKISDDVYALYTHFENPGVNHEGVYSLIIGAQVAAVNALPATLRSVSVPAGRYAVFAVEAGQPQKVGARWQEIWTQAELPRRFVADFERYTPSGQIDIFVGLD